MTSNQQKYISDLTDLYGSTIAELKEQGSLADVESLLDGWKKSLEYLSADTGAVSSLVVLQGLMPLAEEIDGMDGDQFKELFSQVFLAFVASAIGV